MAFKGDLGNINLFDVFQTLLQNRQSGMLILQRGQETKKIHVSPEGVRLLSHHGGRPLRIGEIFVQRGYITPQDVEILLLEQKENYRPIGELLVGTGKVPREDLDAILRYHAEDAIYELFSWDEGSFAFHDGVSVEESSPSPLSEVVLDPAGLCLDAARRLDEIERLRSAIPTNDEFFLAAAGSTVDADSTDAPVAPIHAALDQPRSVDELRDLVGLTLFDVLYALVTLLETESVRPLDAHELADAGRTARDQGKHERAAQLLERAHLAAPEDLELLQECVEAIQRTGDHIKLSFHLATLGRLCQEAELIDEAIEHYERALRHDADHFDVLFHLRDAFAVQGDLDRAVEMSLKIARIYADAGNLDYAVQECETGLEIAPGRIAIRFYLAQLHHRGNRLEESRASLYDLVDETAADRANRDSRQSRELLMSCYRLLLRINPEDGIALAGIRKLESRSGGARRRRKQIAMIAVGAAVLLLAAVVGLTRSGDGAASLFDLAIDAHARGDTEAYSRYYGELLANYPESEEAQRLIQIHNKQRHSGGTPGQDKQAQERARLEEDLRVELNALTKSLEEQPLLEAALAITPFLKRLDDKKAAFFRKSVATELEIAFNSFLDRIAEQFRADESLVARGEFLLRGPYSGDADSLSKLEEDLGRIMNRSWPELIGRMRSEFRSLGKGSLLAGSKKQVERFEKQMARANSALDSIKRLFYTVRAARLECEINEAVKASRQDGIIHLSQCEFDQAQALYADAYERVDALVHEEPREFFDDLIRQLERSGTREYLARKKNEIETIQKELAEIDRIRTESPGQAHEAYTRMRGLVSSFKVVRFEKRFTIPYLVRSNPSGADVMVNGLPAGKTPCAIDLPIGQASDVSVRKAGFDSADTHINPIDPSLTGRLDLALGKQTAWVRPMAGQVDAQPLIFEGMLLMATSNASLVAVRLKDGTDMWEAKSNRFYSIRAAPFVSDGKAGFFLANGELHLVRPTDGEILARHPLEGEVNHDAAQDGDLIYVATNLRHLYALRGTEVIYKKPLAYVPQTPLLLAHGKLYFGTAEGPIMVHDAKTGAEIARLKAPEQTSFFSPLAHVGDIVVGGAEDGHVHAFNHNTEKHVWSFKSVGPVTAPAFSIEDRLFIPTPDGYVRGFTEQGEEKGTFDLGSGAVDARPTLDSQFLYALARRSVVAFDTRRPDDANIWWEHTFEGEAPLHVVTGDGKIIVITESRVVAFERDLR